MKTITQMREICQQRKPNRKGKMVWAGQWFNTLFVRHFSIYITRFFIRIGVSADVITFLNMPLALAGVAMCVPHNLWLNVMGVLFLFLVQVFDCVDGEIARGTGKSSLRGYYLDLVSHVVCDAPVVMICGLRLYLLTEQTEYMIIAFIAYAMAEIRLGLSSVHYRVSAENASDKMATSASPPGSGPTLQKRPYNLLIIVKLSKRLLTILTDNVMIQLVSFVCIFLSYDSILRPAVFFAWFVVVSGIFGIVGAIAYNYFFGVPNVKHTKNV
ncbi:MAG: CDP-alcohol phosphatidyltransferase family protein [Deltaproteobacteria bacterium]|nr:CDP-alcohol phosphatidyltransferase family protein [Deltaproteobacteria bacterium]